MADPIVHLILTGIIAIQRVNDASPHWRIVAPNLANESHHAHVATLVVHSDGIVSSTVPPVVDPDTDLATWILKDATIRIDTPTAEHGAPDTTFPPRVLKYSSGACASPAGDCAKLKARVDVEGGVALEATIAHGKVEATWVDRLGDWAFVRPNKPPAVAGAIADEICLKFLTTDAARQVKLVVSDGGTDNEIVLDPMAHAGEDRIEIRLANLTPKKQPSTKVDPHFSFYYRLSRRVDDKQDRATLTNRSSKEDPDRDHDHLVTTLVEGLTPPRRTAGMSPLAFARLSIGGANCPPIGSDPEP